MSDDELIERLDRLSLDLADDPPAMWRAVLELVRKHDGDLTRCPGCDHLRLEMGQLRADAEIGQRWNRDSSLETWFPYTAEEMEKLRTALTAERERADKAEKALLVPGEMRCAKCKFTLIRTNLYVKSGTTGPGGNDTEPCPNGCGPLWPETWERSARDAWARLETAHDELIAERERADRTEAEVELWKERAYQLSHA